MDLHTKRQKKKKGFSNQLKLLADSINLPWIIIGIWVKFLVHMRNLEAETYVQLAKKFLEDFLNHLDLSDFRFGRRNPHMEK